MKTILGRNQYHIDNMTLEEFKTFVSTKRLNSTLCKIMLNDFDFLDDYKRIFLRGYMRSLKESEVSIGL
jgi:hypothetical protein